MTRLKRFVKTHCCLFDSIDICFDNNFNVFDGMGLKFNIELSKDVLHAIYWSVTHILCMRVNVLSFNKKFIQK